MFVYPYFRPPRDVVDSIPEGCALGRRETGWMRQDVFFEYIANVFISWLKDNNVQRQVILFLDGHRSHLSMAMSQLCEDSGIILYCLLTNATHILQPADIAVFRPLKQNWRKVVHEFQTESNRVVTRTSFAPLAKKVMDLISLQAVRNGFRACGLFL
jgi:hypothetical protein